MIPSIQRLTGSIRRLILLLAATILLSNLAVGAYEMWDDNREHAAQEAIRTYHLSSTVHAEELMGRLMGIRLALGTMGSPQTPPDTDSARREIRALLYNTQEHLTQLTALHRASPNPAFDGTLERIEQASRTLNAAWAEIEQGGPSAPFRDHVAALETRLRQLERLHSTEFQADQQRLADVSRSQDRLLMTLLLLLVGGAGATTIMVLRAVSRLVARQSTTESALVEEEARYRSVAETMSDALVIASEDGHIRSCNPATATLFGYAPEELPGMNVTMLMPEEMAVQHTAALKHFLETGEARVIGSTREAEGQRRDGSRFPLEINLGQTQVKGVRYFTAILRDISARKEAEKHLKDSERKLRRAHQMSRLGHWEWDLDSGILTWSDETFHIFGLRPGSWAPTFDGFHNTVHPDDVDRLDSALSAALEQGAPYDLKFRIMWPDQSVRHVHAVGEGTRHPETGAVTGMSGTILDISDTMQVLEALEETTAELAKAQRIAGVGHWVWDIPTGGLFWSDQCYRIVGYEPGAVTPSYELFLASVHPDDKEKVIQAIEFALTNHTTYSVEHRVMASDGSIHHVREQGEATYHPTTGAPLKMLGTALDITERVHAEQAIRDSQATMLQAQKVGRIGHWVLDLETGSAACSDETMRILGLPPQESNVPLEKILGELVLPEYRDRHRAMIQQAIETGGTFSDPHRIRRPDGEVRWAHVAGEAVCDPHTGLPLRLVGILQDIHEQKMVEQALEESRTGLDRAQQLAHVGHWEWSPDSGQVAFSSEIIRILGEDTETYAPTYDAFMQAVHPEDRQRVERCTRVTARTGKPHDTEYRIVQPTGRQRIVHSVGERVAANEGEPARVICALHDVTAQRESEHAIRRLNAELEQRVVERTRDLEREKSRVENYLALAGTIFVALDTEGRITLINRKGCELLGRAEEDLLGEDWFDTALPPESADAVRAFFVDAMNGNSVVPVSFENEIGIPGGPRHTIAWQNTELLDDDGVLIGTLSSGLDITDRRAAEEALHALHRQTDLILSTVAEGIYGLNPDGITTFANPAAAHLTGWTVEELAGRSQHDTIHHSHADGSPYDRADCPIFRSIREGTTCHVTDEVFWRKDGTSFPVEYTVTPILDDSAVSGAVVTFRDVTERRRAEAELRSAQRMQALGNLAGGIAHSLNNLLLPIGTLSQITRDELEPEDESWQNLDRVMQASKRAADLTNRILTFSRYDEPRMEMIDLPALISDTLELIRRTTPSSIRIYANIDRDAGITLADAGQLESVVMNLVSNSVDALADQPGDIVVSVTHGDPDDNGFADGSVNISITDTGPGIPEKIRERVFDPFFTTKPVGKGTGLGLAMAHGIVTRHGGIITIAENNGGASIRIRLPRAAATTADARQTQKKESHPHGTHTDH
ncbi:MAG: PAS domain S-box protein [Nitrospirota bacterium]|nr:PAS domain S-box protein [Nitrospirota bacterium]